MKIRSTRTATLILGALLSTGLVFAQSEPQSQAPDTSAQPAQQAAQPQQGRYHRGNPNRQAHRLAKRLNLSKDQVAQIKPILADRAQQMQALRADTSMAPADRRAKAQTIMQDSKTKIETVLNDQQKQQFEQLLAQRREHRHPNQPNSQPGL
ncbi:MAG TPA: hypothetical protein VG267_05560 [Terracidiphilus sp.]|jgi:Spy/CpxP family protein refolding chaperone|nr:hypothetical protein [Terracidiphilus sp.]